MKKIFVSTLLAAALAGCATQELTSEQQALLTGINSPDADSVMFELSMLNHHADFQDANGKTPLIHAVMNGNQKKIREVLSTFESAINAADENGLTALHYAAGSASPEPVNLLLGYGADINVLDKYGKTPLMEAARLGSEGIVMILCENGADRSVMDKQGRTAAVFAAGAKENSLKMIQFLRSENDTDMLLVCAAIAGKNHETAVALLPEKLSEAEGLLIMKQAIMADDRKMVKLMLDRNVPLNLNSDTLYKALRPARLKNWIRTSANLELIGNGQTPIFWAAQQNNPAIIKILLDAGADASVKDKHRYLPMDYTRDRDTYNMLKKAMSK